MKRLLRHPINSIREPFGKAGLIVAVVALIAALGGSAYALTGADKKLIKKEAKKWSQKFAKPGPAGPQGLAGAPGANGNDGTNGKDGAAGKDGNGTNGKSVVVGTFTTEEEENEEPAGEPCDLNGGVEVEVEGSGQVKYVCNGAPGAEGSPWAAGGTLPVGSTQTGAWHATISVPQEEVFEGTAAISFPIPLAAELAESKTIVVESGESPVNSNCDDGTGTAAGPSHPEADSGYLCVFVVGGSPLSVQILKPTSTATFPIPSEKGASTTGARVLSYTSSAGQAVWGTFAVTG